MPIVYHEKSKEFHLYNEEISYLFRILDNGQPGQLYYGKKLRDRASFEHLFERCTRDMAPYNCVIRPTRSSGQMAAGS